MGEKRFQIGAEIVNRGKRDSSPHRDFKSWHGLQIDAEHNCYTLQYLADFEIPACFALQYLLSCVINLCHTF